MAEEGTELNCEFEVENGGTGLNPDLGRQRCRETEFVAGVKLIKVNRILESWE